jgi:DivIVA domain-containing protein
VRGERGLLRIGEYLVGRAARLLPGEIRDERRREWTAELPAILRDRDTRLAAHRAARMLRYAAGTAWGTARAAGGARGRLTAVRAVVAGLCAASVLAVVVTDTFRAVQGTGDWVPYFWIAAGGMYLAGLGGVLALRIRRAAKPVEEVRHAVVAYGATIIPDWLVSRLLRAVGADESGLAGLAGAGRSPAPGPAEPAATTEQAISMARDTAGRFYRARWRPGYQAAEVDEFIARIEATLAGNARPGQVVTATDVEAVKFGTTRRGGYDEEVVDEALDRYADGLARLGLFPGPQ